MTLSPRAPWVPVVVATAAFVTVGLLGKLADQAWLQAMIVGEPSASTEVGAVLGGIGAVALLATMWTWRYRDVSPWARAAVALVCVHVAIAAGAWFLSSRLHSPERELPLQSELPAPYVALGAGALLFVMAAVHCRVRRLSRAPGWLRGAVVFALAFLLLLGIWIPLALDVTEVGVELALLPPAVIALVAAAVIVLRPAGATPLVPVTAAILAVGVLAALVVRAGATPERIVAYANYVHVLFAAAWFALCALGALAWTHARLLRANRADTARAAPWVQRGVVVPAAGEREVAAWHIDGWLAGLRTSLAPFTLRTDRGAALLVPAGGRLVGAIPAATANAPGGAHLPVLHAGDAVIVSGFVEAAGDGPYRTAAIPVPGPDGLVVTLPRRAHELIGRDVILVLYRPCVLFLIVAALAALPGLAGH